MANREQHPPDEMLIRSLDGELSPAETRALDVHLATCADCRARRNAVNETLSAASGAVHEEHMNRILRPPTGFFKLRRRLADLKGKCDKDGGS